MIPQNNCFSISLWTKEKFCYSLRVNLSDSLFVTKDQASWRCLTEEPQSTPAGHMGRSSASRRTTCESTQLYGLKTKPAFARIPPAFQGSLLPIVTVWKVSLLRQRFRQLTGQWAMPSSAQLASYEQKAQLKNARARTKSQRLRWIGSWWHISGVETRYFQPSCFSFRKLESAVSLQSTLRPPETALAGKCWSVIKADRYLAIIWHATCKLRYRAMTERRPFRSFRPPGVIERERSNLGWEKERTKRAAFWKDQRKSTEVASCMWKKPWTSE